MNYLNELSKLEDGTIVLAATERVARHLKMQSALLQAVEGRKAWFAKGSIKTITNWIETAWLNLMPAEQLLFPIQELAVVKGVIDSSGLLPETMISSTGTARRVAKAYSLVQKYQIEMDQERFRFKREFEVFYEWVGQIDAACKRDGWVFRSKLPELLIEAVRAGAVPLPQKVVIVGLIEMNPSERQLFEVLRSLGTEVVDIPTTDLIAEPNHLRPNNQADELSAAAQWANGLLSAHVDNPLGAPNIAILVPDVRQYQMPLIEALALHVSPGVYFPSKESGEVLAPWDISSGATLGSRPIIRAAMDALAITPDQADLEVFSRVLRSPWIGGGCFEASSRALLDIWLRENMGLSMGGNDFLRAVGSYKGAVPDFRSRLTNHLGTFTNGDQARYPSEWAAQFITALSDFGWPGSIDLNSEDFQTLNAWEDALAVFRSLDGQLGTITQPRANMWLREVIDTKQFQPRIAHVAPISILGFEEAIGLRFDNVWILGASNSVLPLRVDPSPFIPAEMQASAGIAEASGDGSLEKARKIVASLLSICDDVTVSCPAHGDKGSAIGPCDLFGAWPGVVSTQTNSGALVSGLLGKLDRTIFDPEVVPPVTDEELPFIKGGVRIFEDYAEAPFFAFVRSRLAVSEFPEPSIGLDPRMQGTMLHLTLERFWSEVKKSKTLKGMDRAAVEAKVLDAVSEASDKLLNKFIWRYGARVIALERMRLCTLMMDWLDLELQREFDFEVLGFEEGFDLVIGDIALTVKVDRRDRVFLKDDESEYRDIVIDYKSGKKINFAGLNAGTLTEPQLPIYATKIDYTALIGKPIDGIALAQVNSDAIGFHTRSNFTGGLVERKKPGKGDVSTDPAWTAQVEAWEQSLDEMAAGFMAGVAQMEFDGEGVGSRVLPMGYEYIAPITR